MASRAEQHVQADLERTESLTGFITKLRPSRRPERGGTLQESHVSCAATENFQLIDAGGANGQLPRVHPCYNQKQQAAS